MLLKKSRRFLLLSVTLHRRHRCYRVVSHAGHAASSKHVCRKGMCPPGGTRVGGLAAEK
jgi:hypothetical protein